MWVKCINSGVIQKYIDSKKPPKEIELFLIFFCVENKILYIQYLR